MSIYDIFSLVIIYLIYLFFTFGVITTLNKMGVSQKYIFIISFVIVSFILGVAAAWTWPDEGAVWVNPLAVLLGDLIYRWSIAIIGNPSSANAHETIPWLLRVPQVYALVSLMLGAATGVIVQLAVGQIINWRENRSHSTK